MTSRYPESPGFKTGGTSQEAAESVAGRAKPIKEKILAVLSRRPMTADEVADGFKESILFIRPRFSELKAAHLIEETGERRKNSSGQSASVWRVKSPPIQAEQLSFLADQRR